MKIDKLLIDILKVKRPSSCNKTYNWFSNFLDENDIKTTRDINNNHYLYIPYSDKKTVNHCFTSHYDTVHMDYGHNDMKIIGKTIYAKGDVLGADCGAGMWLMIKMIKNKTPGFYCFFSNEEIGGLGSSAFDVDLLNDINIMISFDRMNTNEVIITQGGTECASVEAGNWLSKQLSTKKNKYTNSDKGSFTDSLNFIDDIEECFNISVGYYHQHTQKEKLDYQHLTRLLNKLYKIDFSLMPIMRDKDVDLYDWDILDDSNLEQKEIKEYASISSITELENFVYANSELVAEFLLDNDITVADMLRYS